MKFNLIPPAIIRIRKDKGGYALARGPYITLPADTTPHQLPHELIHVKQWWMLTAICAAALYVVQMYVPSVPMEAMGLSVGVHGGLYAGSKLYRFWAETQAYRMSLSVSPEREEDFAKMLNGYDTGRTLEECKQALL